MRRLPFLLVLVVCSCSRERPRETSPPSPLPAPVSVPVRAEDPNLSTYRPAVAAYLEDVRALPKLVRERSGQRAYAKALDSSEELFSRIPYAPPGSRYVERALKALRKAANECQAAIASYDRSVATELGMKRLDPQGGNGPDAARMAREREKNFASLQRAGETMRARIEQVEALLAESP